LPQSEQNNQSINHKRKNKMIKKTNLLIMVLFFFLTTACGNKDTDIHGNKLPKEHPWRSGKVVGKVENTFFNQFSAAGIWLFVRDDNGLITRVVLSYNPDREKINSPYKNDSLYHRHLADVREKMDNLDKDFKDKYAGTRVECEVKDFIIKNPKEKREPGDLGTVFGSCQQYGEPVGDWLASESMVVKINSVKAYLDRSPRKKKDPMYKDKHSKYIVEDHPWRSKKIVGTVDKIEVKTAHSAVAIRVKDNITKNITGVLMRHDLLKTIHYNDPDFIPLLQKMEKIFNNKYVGKKIKCDITRFYIKNQMYYGPEDPYLGSVEGVCNPDIGKWVGPEIDRILSERKKKK